LALCLFFAMIHILVFNVLIMYLFFDTETTGLPKNYKAEVTDLENWPRLVQLAWLVYNEKGEEIAEGNRIVKPEGFTIPKQASDVHGISTERALAEGLALSEVMQEFAEVVKEAKLLVAHNMSFDEKIAGAEFLRQAIEHDLFNTARFCTKEASTNFCAIPGPYGYKWPTLSELHIKLFDRDFEGAHDALVDVRACADCFFALVKKGVIS